MDVAVAGDKAYVVDSDFGLRIFDISVVGSAARRH
ncbi:MAG: hypothetical protein IIB72_12590 [Proteobacteria bacterium]|nr:hypothetical protein [Pseudomonadota bacterium]